MMFFLGDNIAEPYNSSKMLYDAHLLGKSLTVINLVSKTTKRLYKYICINISVFWDVTARSLVDRCKCFGITC
jgi:hypothetical protein